jgi:hypothetical protein
MQTDYLDADVAYLIGMILGRGTLVDDGARFVITITFPFVNPELEGYDQFAGFVASIASTVLPRLKALLGDTVNLSISPQEDVTFTAEFPSRHIVIRNLKLILQDQLEYKRFIVPEVIQKSNDLEIIREFVRGFADVAGNIRRSNRDQARVHRVYLDVLNENWKLPVQLCDLLQHKLGVPVANILWGHPNLRDPRASQPRASPFREHQIRIYAHHFLQVGFYVGHKHTVLELLARENKQHRKDSVGSFCAGHRSEGREKIRHPLEKDQRLPRGVRGKHFDSYWEICAACGCQYAQRAIREIRRQKPLAITEDGEVKVDAINLRHFSQVLGYAKVARPTHAFIISPQGWTSSLHRLIRDFKRVDVLEYAPNRYIAVAKWDLSSASIRAGEVLTFG